VLFDGVLAGRALRLSSGAEPSDAPVSKEAPAPVTPLHSATTESALQLLGLLQREARLVDFVMPPHSSRASRTIARAISSRATASARPQRSAL
jgi:hypothetical protein